MSSDLSQSLIDAAAEALHALRCGCGGPVSDAHEHIEAGEVAVAAVLETLATHTGPRKDMSKPAVMYLNHDEFVRLAAEIKEGQHGDR